MTGPLRVLAAAALAVAFSAWLAGCGWFGWRGPAAVEPQEELRVDPLPVQQLKAYPETVTGRFISLADFEDAPLSGRPGFAQVRDFSISPAAAAGKLRFVVNVTRTGAGGMEASLPNGSFLTYRMPKVHDFSDFTLLTMAVHSETIRDDLHVMLATDRAGWESRGVLLKSGWNYVRIDIQRLKALADFDVRGVREIRLRFAGPADPTGGGKPVVIGLDDIMLVDNRREVRAMPEGIRLVKTGLDYDLHLPGRAGPVRIRQGDDGLWRMGDEQAVVAMIAEGAASPADPGGREDLEVMGPRRVGEVELLEHNAMRLRLANTWYFPAEAGQWESLTIRRIRWEYTFYADGRRVTDVVVNNAGGRRVARVAIRAAREAMWSDGTRRRTLVTDDFDADVGRWAYLTAGAGEHGRLAEASFAHPGTLEVRMGQVELCDGDADGDGFDESRGCYRLRAADTGHCRFYLAAPAVGVVDPVFQVSGRWDSDVTAGSEGVALRGLTRLADGSALFVVGGRVAGRRWVEVTGAARWVPQERP